MPEVTPLNTILNWFKSHLKPSQEQFANAFSSLRHKQEKIALDDLSTDVKNYINGAVSSDVFATGLNAKADQTTADALQSQTNIISEAIFSKADLENGKIPLSQIPDGILGQVVYKGLYMGMDDIITSGDPAINGFGLMPSTEETIGWYFIMQDDVTLNVNGIEYNIGDWLISNGLQGWGKVDNTDSIPTINGRTGPITLSKADVGLYNVPNLDTSSPSNIVQSPNYRFVNDTEKATYLTPALKSNNLTSSVPRSGNTIYGFVDQFTGEPVSANKATTKPGGLPVTDADRDDIIYFKVGNEFFKRNFITGGTYNVNIFGAHPDNADNLTAINKAIANVKGVLQFDGFYDISDQLYPGGNITFKGTDRFRSCIRFKDNAAATGNSVNNVLVRVQAKSNVTFENITFDANSINQPVGVVQTNCLELSRSSSNITIRGCRFMNARTGPGYVGGFGILSSDNYGGSGLGGADNVTIDDCDFENIGQSDIGLFDAENWLVTNCRSKNTGYSCLNIESETNSRFIRNIIVRGWVSNNTRNLITAIENINTGPVSDIHVSDFISNVSQLNVGDDMGTIRVRGTKRVTIDNITINNTASIGIRVSTDSNKDCNDLTLSNITVNGAGTYGIWAESSKGEISAGVPYTANINNLTIDTLKVNASADLAYNLKYISNLKIVNPHVQNAGGIAGIIVNACRVSKILTPQLKDITQGVGIRLQDTVDTTILGGTTENSASNGVYISGTSDHVTVLGHTVFDSRTTKVIPYGILSDVSTPNPTYMLVGNDMARVVNQAFSLPGSINILKSNNTGDAYRNINNIDAQTFLGTMTFSETPYVGKQQSGKGGAIRLLNDTGAQKFLMGILGNAGGNDYYIYDIAKGTARLRIDGETGGAYFTGTVNGAAPVAANDFTIKSYVDARQSAYNADAVSANATDLASALTLLNELKAVVNSGQAKMRSGNLMAGGA